VGGKEADLVYCYTIIITLTLSTCERMTTSTCLSSRYLFSAVDSAQSCNIGMRDSEQDNIRTDCVVVVIIGGCLANDRIINYLWYIFSYFMT
jgi:hypothetical protein